MSDDDWLLKKIHARSRKDNVNWWRLQFGWIVNICRTKHSFIDAKTYTMTSPKSAPYILQR